MSGKLSVNELATPKITSSGDLVLQANSENYITCASGGNIEFHKPIDLNSVDLTEVDIKSGTIDSTAISNSSIGATGHSTGKFTTLEATTSVNFNNKIENDDINTTAAIAFSKLEALDDGKLLIGSAANVATKQSISGDITISNAGVATVGAEKIDNGKIEDATITRDKIQNGTLQNADINASAGIEFSKLEGLTAGQIVLGNASNVPTDTAISGDIAITNAGVVSISAGAIVNADVNTSAGIAGSKLQSQALPFEIQNEGGFSADKVLTAAQLVGGMFRGSPSAPKTITTPSASDLVAYLSNATVNLGWVYIVRNEASGGPKKLTMVAGTGCSLIGHADIAEGKVRHYMVHITNVGSGTEAYDLISITDDFPHS